MPKRLRPGDYDCNEDWAYDVHGIDSEDGHQRYECSSCAKGFHDECQKMELWSCACFLIDHEEAF